MAKRFKAIATLFFRGDDTQYRSTIGRLQARALKDGEAIQKNLARGFVLAGGFGFAVKQFADFEQGLSGVRKTSGLVGEELQQFGERIRVMAQDSVFGTDALLATAQAAAQLGITGVDNILAYTDAITKLAAASDFSPEEAAFALARLSEIAELDPSKVNNLAATFTALGNSIATTEKELNDSAVAVAAAGSSYGVAVQDALGMAAAFASVGQASFANGTAVGNFFSNLSEAARDGGDKLQAFADVMGVGTQEVIRLFRDDAVGAFQLYTEGLGKFGKEADLYLERSGILEAKSQRLFKSVGGSIGEALDVARDGFENGTAHIEEYDGMVDNLISSFKILLGSLELVAIELGERLNPALRRGVDETRAFVNTNRGAIVDSIESLGRLALAWIAARIAIGGVRIAMTGAAFAAISLHQMFLPLNVVIGKAAVKMETFRRAAKSAFKKTRTYMSGAAITKNMELLAQRMEEAKSPMNWMRHWTKLMRADLKRLKFTFNGWAAAKLTGLALLKAAWAALRFSVAAFFGMFVLFMPETIRFLVKALPAAVDYVSFKFRRFGNTIEGYFVQIQVGFAKMVDFYMQGVDLMAASINKLFGTDLPTTAAAGWALIEREGKAAIAELDKENKRLEILTEKRWRTMSEAFGDYVKDVKKSAGDLVGMNFVSSGTNVPLVSQGQSGLGGAKTAKSEEQKAAEEAAATAKAARDESQRDFAQRLQRLDEWGRAASEENNREKSRLRELSEARHQVAMEQAARTQMEVKEAEERERRIAEARHQVAMEEAARTQREAADEQAVKEERDRYALETELEVYRRKLMGQEEATIEHYERMRELEAEIEEAKTAKDEEELARLLRRYNLEEKAWKEKERKKTMDTIAEGARASKAIQGERGKLTSFLTAMQKAEALYNLAVKGPGLAAEAYGRAQAAFPPPFGQVLGAAAAAAVIAKMTAAAKEIEMAKPSGFAAGGVVPGYGMTDSHRALLTPGEVVTPRKNYSDVEDGIRARMRREDGGDYFYDEPQRLDINVQASDDLARFIEVQSDAAEVQRV